MKSPRVYQKLIQEIDTAVQNGKVSRPVITYEESLQLPYYQACIKESMRLSPSAPSMYFLFFRNIECFSLPLFTMIIVD